MRLILADDDRQRYSAWYRDYSLAIGGGEPDNEPSSAGQPAVTRSQQLLGMSPVAVSAANSLASIVDLQIALLTALPTAPKPVQVRLTRRSQCSDLRGYSAQGQLASSASSPYSVPSYASPSASSGASSTRPAPGRAGSQQHLATMAMMLALTVTSMLYTTLERRPVLVVAQNAVHSFWL